MSAHAVTARRTARRVVGVTLLELMVVTALLAVLMAIAYGAAFSQNRFRDAHAAMAEAETRARAALDMMTDELSLAGVSAGASDADRFPRILDDEDADDDFSPAWRVDPRRRPVRIDPSGRPTAKTFESALAFRVPVVGGTESLRDHDGAPLPLVMSNGVPKAQWGSRAGADTDDPGAPGGVIVYRLVRSDDGGNALVRFDTASGSISVLCRNVEDVVFERPAPEAFPSMMRIRLRLVTGRRSSCLREAISTIVFLQGVVEP